MLRASLNKTFPSFLPSFLRSKILTAAMETHRSRHRVQTVNTERYQHERGGTDNDNLQNEENTMLTITTTVISVMMMITILTILMMMTTDVIYNGGDDHYDIDDIADECGC